MLPTLLPAPPIDFPKLLIKAQPEDFVVEEIPLYEPCGSGTHSYIYIEKRGLNSLDAVKKIANALNKRSADAGVAGLKDARAIARQWISIEHLNDEHLAKLAAFSDDRIKILKVSRHGNKLKTGHLRGNRFNIRLRTEPALVDKPPAAHSESVNRVIERARKVLNQLHQRGVPNYFGTQRFGRGGDNSALGRLLVLGDNDGFKKAFAAQQGEGRVADRKIRNLMVNAFQSELFNKVLALRMPDIHLLKAGDLAQLQRNGAVFSIKDETEAAKEQPRADSFEISPSGPMYGEKTLLADGMPGEIERKVLTDAGVKLEDFSRREAERQPGARRPLRVPFLEAPQVEADSEGVMLSFALPSGAYATIVLREITGEDAVI